MLQEVRSISFDSIYSRSSSGKSEGESGSGSGSRGGKSKSKSNLWRQLLSFCCCTSNRQQM